MPIQNAAQYPIATELTKLPGCSIHQLRERWCSLFGGDTQRESYVSRL